MKRILAVCCSDRDWRGFFTLHCLWSWIEDERGWGCGVGISGAHTPASDASEQWSLLPFSSCVNHGPLPPFQV